MALPKGTAPHSHCEYSLDVYDDQVIEDIGEDDDEDEAIPLCKVSAVTVEEVIPFAAADPAIVGGNAFTGCANSAKPRSMKTKWKRASSISTTACTKT